MKKVLLNILSMLLLSQAIVYSQSILERAERTKKISQDRVSQNVLPLKSFNRTSQSQVGFTDYDYAGNVGIPELVSDYDIDGDGVLDPLGVFNQRFSITGDGLRRAEMFVGIQGEFATFPVSDSTLNSGFPVIHSITEGPWAGHSAVMFQQGGKANLSLVDISTFNFVYYHEELDFSSLSSSFCYLNDGTIYVIDTDSKLRKLMADNPTQSTETGMQFHQGAASQPIKSSSNDEYLAVLGFTEEDEVLLYYSSDKGETWNEEVIGQNLVSEVENRPGVFPLFTNFAQASYVVDTNGTVHIGMNGYGLLIEGNDTSFTYPALYWNSNYRDWIAVSDPDEEGEELTGLSPGNGIGNAYPTPVVSENGNLVSVVYQSPEFESGILHVYESDNSSSEYECYYTDIKETISTAGGSFFWQPRIVGGNPYESDILPTALDQFARGTPSYHPLPVSIFFMYMTDVIPGCSLFEENSVSEDSYWNFYTFDYAVDVNDEEEKKVNYMLEQNYPNPFNPNTSIKYQVASIEKVNLKVYDILGREIRTLVNEINSPGSYEVKFDASELSSGIYFYTLTSGSFTQTRKMILMK